LNGGIATTPTDPAVQEGGEGSRGAVHDLPAVGNRYEKAVL